MAEIWYNAEILNWLTTRGHQIFNIQNPEHTHQGNESTALARKVVSKMKSAMDGIGATPASSEGIVYLYSKILRMMY